MKIKIEKNRSHFTIFCSFTPYLFVQQGISLSDTILLILKSCHLVDMFTEEYFMQQAFKQAEKAFEEGEVPVGAVVVCNDLIIAKAHNQTELLTDVTAHAEIIALTSAAEYLGSKYLQDCTMYVTLEPCVMCAGALSWAQLGRLVFGASDDKKGFFRYGKELLHPKTVVLQGVMEAQCSGLVKEFFKNKR